MQSAPKIFIAIIIGFIFTACSSNNSANANANSTNQSANSANSNSANAVKDDVDELEMTIKLPIHPEEAVWREENLAKTGAPPTNKKLVAVLLYTKENADKIVAQAEKYKPATPEIINNENWFPNELTAQSQISGDETLKGKGYPANDFFNAPYTDGKITRIDGTDYFILELFAK